MDSAKLSRKLHEQLDGLLDSIMSHDPDDGIVDLKLIFTATNDRDLTSKHVAQVELVQLTSEDWIVEHTMIYRSDEETLF